MMGVKSKGWGVLQMSALGWGSGVHLAEWTLNTLGAVDDKLYAMLQRTKTAFCLTEIKIRLKGLRFLLSIESINVYVSPTGKPAGEQFEKQSSAPNLLLMRITLWFARLLVSIIRKFWIVRVKSINILFTHIPKDIKTEELQFWNALQLSLQSVAIFEERATILDIKSVQAFECIVNEVERSVITTREVANIPAVRMCNGTVGKELKLSADGIDVNLWPTTLLLITSAVAEGKLTDSPLGTPSDTVSVDSSSVTDPSSPSSSPLSSPLPSSLPSPDSSPISSPTSSPASSPKSAVLDILRVVFPIRQLFSAILGNVLVNLHLPKSKEETHRFEALQLTLTDLRAFARLDPGEIPQFFLLGQDARMSSLGADKIGPAIQSVIQKLFEERHEGRVDDLLTVSNAFFGNCWPQVTQPVDFRLTDVTIQRWIKDVLDGKPAWRIGTSGDEYFASAIGLVKEVGEPLYDRFSKSVQPFQEEEFALLPQTLIARVGSIGFDVPFEYPLSNLFDHLTYFIKTVKAPFQKTSNRQDFNLFASTWRLIIQSNMARFSLADDAFETRLQKIFRLKRQIVGKCTRLDQLFWKQCKEEREHLKTLAVEERWVPMQLRSLAGSSTHPEILKATPHLANKYYLLQEELFSLYRQHMEGRKEKIRPLFQVKGANVDFCIRWNRDYAKGMDQLLNSIDSEGNFADGDVKEFGLFLGGFVDVSANNLKVVLRDFALPLCYTKNVHIMGLLFIVEAASYRNAQSQHLIRVIDTLTGRCNLLGLDNQCRAPISHVLLPTKIYHSLQISAFTSTEPTLMGFSPLFEGTFHMLDRAFELFSKPSEEMSPFLPFWDKLRMLLRGTDSSVCIKGPCRVVALAGTDLHSTDETLSLVFPHGFEVGMNGAEIRLHIPSAVAYMNSESESLLRWLHETTGSAFAATDAELVKIPAELVGHLPVLSLPRVEFGIRFEMNGINGRKPISHHAIRICAASNYSATREDADFDSYRFFRIHDLSIAVTVDASKEMESRLLVFYYREMEEWIVRNFARFITPPVKPGKLFQFGTLSKKATPKLSSVLTEVQFRLSFRGFLCARALQYYDTSNFGGILMRSSGRTQCWLAYRRSNQRSENPNHGKWFQYFAQVEYGELVVGVITVDERARPNQDKNGREGESEKQDMDEQKSPNQDMDERKSPFQDKDEKNEKIMDKEKAADKKKTIDKKKTADKKKTTDKEKPTDKEPSTDKEEPPETKKHRRNQDDLRTKGLPFEYAGVAMYDVLIAPNLSYLSVDKACFKYDTEAALVQKKILGMRLAELNEIVDSLAGKLRGCDPTSNMKRFAGIKRQLSGFLDQQTYISNLLDEKKGLDWICHHQFIIQNAQVLWHQGIRDAVFSLVDQQFQFFRCTHGLGFSALYELSTADAIAEVLPTPLASPPPRGAEMADAVFAELMERIEPLDVGPETRTEETKGAREELMCDPLGLSQLGMCITLLVDVQFVNPQILLLDTEDAADPAVLIVTAQNASAKYGTVRNEEYGTIVGRRTKVVLEQALMYAAFRPDFEASHWPPLYPVEYLLTTETEASKFHRISEKIHATFVYDVSNQRYAYGTHSSPIRRVFGEGDTIRVDAGAFSLLTTSAEYCVLYDVIVNLLVYRDPTQKMRHDQLEAIILATDIFHQAEMTVIVQKMQQDVRQLKRALSAKLSRALNRGNVVDSAEFERLKGPWDEVALVVDALRIAQANRDKLRQRQTRLLLDVSIDRIQWTMSRPDAVLCELILHGDHVTWLSAADGSQSSLIEIGAVRGYNRLPDAFYRTVIAPIPDEIRDALYSSGTGFRGIGTQGNTARFFLKARPPVSGIRILEHVELNLAPLQFQFTFDIGEELIKFFFPETTVQSPVETKESEETGLLGGIKESIKSTATSFFSRVSEQVDDADVELMRTRAVDNCSFIYINIPASQHLISYKVTVLSQLWSWLELTLQLRRDAIRVLLSNAGALFKDKIRRLGQANAPEGEALVRTASRIGQRVSENYEDEDQKAKMLLGKSYRK
ncbi:hypothetical protein PSACC_03557 [Paramicrosporidium saccamoebae]|uniref:FMP27/BLTP2/Hobbit GFWDK motif-containing RBG unit domain-containing protein n=1 Tax=Paramicrosporidium saccamoebae TaxID=1246581 RepID=A0A2H9TFY0_9FUNG|nr:hypothetical protein PSACC_03557 [Paramicrosporidium saccamoebae]